MNIHVLVSCLEVHNGAGMHCVRNSPDVTDVDVRSILGSSGVSRVEQRVDCNKRIAAFLDRWNREVHVNELGLLGSAGAPNERCAWGHRKMPFARGAPNEHHGGLAVLKDQNGAAKREVQLGDERCHPREVVHESVHAGRAPLAKGPHKGEAICEVRGALLGDSRRTRDKHQGTQVKHAMDCHHELTPLQVQDINMHCINVYQRYRKLR